MNQSTAKTLFIAAVFTIISVFAITVFLCVRIRGSRISLPRVRHKRRSYARRARPNSEKDVESSHTVSRYHLSLPSFPSISWTPITEISHHRQPSEGTTTSTSSDSFSIISISPSNPVTVAYEGEGGRGIVTFVLTPPTPPTNTGGGMFEGSMVIYDIYEDNEEDEENDDESPTRASEE